MGLTARPFAGIWRRCFDMRAIAVPRSRRHLVRIYGPRGAFGPDKHRDFLSVLLDKSNFPCSLKSRPSLLEAAKQKCPALRTGRYARWDSSASLRELRNGPDGPRRPPLSSPRHEVGTRSPRIDLRVCLFRELGDQLINPVSPRDVICRGARAYLFDLLIAQFCKDAKRPFNIVTRRSGHGWD